MNTNKKQMIKQHIKLAVLAFVNRTAAIVAGLVIWSMYLK